MDKVRKKYLTKLNHQNQLIKKTHHIKNIQDEIKNGIIYKNEKLFSFWILASLNWLVKPPFGKCNKCPDEKNNTNHLFKCKLLENDTKLINDKFKFIFIKYKIPNPLLNSTLKLNVFDITQRNILNPKLLKKIYPKNLLSAVIEYAAMDKLKSLCGFLPNSLHKLIKHYKPQTYTDDIKDIRLYLLESYHDFWIAYQNQLNNNNEIKGIEKRKNYTRSRSLKKLNHLFRPKNGRKLSNINFHSSNFDS